MRLNEDKERMQKSPLFRRFVGGNQVRFQLVKKNRRGCFRFDLLKKEALAIGENAVTSKLSSVEVALRLIEKDDVVKKKTKVAERGNQSLERQFTMYLYGNGYTRVLYHH